MSIKLATKFFLGVSGLLLIALGFLSYFFAQIATEERERSIFDTLANRSRIDALELQIELSRGRSLEELADSMGLTLIGVDGEMLGRGQALFAGSILPSSLPPSGSLVRACLDLQKQEYQCSFSKLPEHEAWLFDWIRRDSIISYLSEILWWIVLAGLILLSIGLISALVLSRWLSRPIARLAKATEKISLGNYDKVELPQDRGDEIGSLISAFKKMISDLKDRERNLAMTGLKLAHSARLATVGQLGASIAHEVKNPLSSMKGYARILVEGVKDPELNESARIIQSEADRCTQILEQMLRFSRDDAGKKSLIQISELLNSTALLLKAEARSRSVKLKIQSEGDYLVQVNAQQLQQVLINLIQNALHASPEESEIEVLSKQTSNGYIQIEVRDHGRGIPTDIQEHVFEAFFTTKDEGGTGLGLAISAELIERQGGTLSFESIPNQGTSFRITLPSA